ncbi:MAG: hypothetical protein J6K76_04145 [Spirochaetaceae bacterium]|nr:hypothetical protein [Spirochaetaceae bacterium]
MIFFKKKIAIRTLIAVGLVTFVAGCYNVSYEILEVTTLATSAKKVFKSLGEVVLFEKNNGQVMIQDNEDTAENLESIEYNNGLRIPTSVLIPAGAVLPNGQRVGSQGRLVAVGDARWTGNSDLPQKASAWLRYSDDGGKNWSKPQLAVHFDDYDMSTASGLTMDGVVTGDPTIGRTATNRLIMLSTFGGTSTGNWTGGWSNRGDGLNQPGDAYFQVGNSTNDWNDTQHYLRLRKNTKEYFDKDDTSLEPGTDPDMDGKYTEPKSDGEVYTGDWMAEEFPATNDNYCYYVDVRGGEIKKASANGTCDPESDPGTGLFVDENYFLYLDRHFEHKFMVKQLKKEGGVVKKGEKDVHCHLFMGLSPYQVWRGCTFIGMSYSDDGGVTWSPHRDITYMVRPKEHSDRTNRYFFVSPCGGYLHDGMSDEVAEKQGGNNRLLFSAYCSAEAPVVFWTDDNGETWEHATDGGKGDQYMGNSSSSETTIVGHPDGVLIAISRGTPPQWAVSLDGGVTWQPKGNFRDILPEVSGRNLMSAVVLDWTTNTAGDTLIALSAACSAGNDRKNGHVFILSIEPDGSGSYTLNPAWNGTTVKSSVHTGDYAYSSVCELANGDLAVFFEGESSNYLLKFVDVTHND